LTVPNKIDGGGSSLAEINHKTHFPLLLAVIMLDDDALKQAANVIDQSKYLIALTGAGISKESNVPTFRGTDGLWRQYDAMQLANPAAFRANPQLVWEWYSWRQGLISECNPNHAHEVLAIWEKKGLLKCIITQNVDGLHRRAGSISLHELHGNIWNLKCISCGHHEHLEAPAVGVPTCPLCNSYMRPDVVWFGESLNREIMIDVYNELDRADACIVIGTSALVQPAATLPLIVREQGGSIIEVNIAKTPLTSKATIHLNGSAGDVLFRLNALLR
jgi:NAD-dependent deacetylase